ADPHYRSAYQLGFAGVNRPDGLALPGMTILPPHGMALLSPFLILAPLGWWRMWRQPATRGNAVVCTLVCVATGLFISTLVDWRGGWSVSVRYLVTVLPFALEGVAAAIAPREARPARFIFVAGAIVGIVQTALAAVTFPNFPPNFRDPCFDLAIPLLLRGCVNGTLRNSAAPPAELIPFAALMLIAIGWIVRATSPAESGRRL